MEQKTFAGMVAQRLEALRHANGLARQRMNGPSANLVAALRDLGISMVSHYDTWCTSYGCTHQSHDAGQDWVDAWIPSSWVDEAKDATQEVWDYADDQKPLFMLPTRELVVEQPAGSYAGYAWIVDLRPEVKVLLRIGLRIGKEEHDDDSGVPTRDPE